MIPLNLGLQAFHPEELVQALGEPTAQDHGVSLPSAGMRLVAQQVSPFCGPFVSPWTWAAWSLCCISWWGGRRREEWLPGREGK